MKKSEKAKAKKELAELQERVNALNSIINAPENTMEVIKSYEDACEFLGEDPKDLPFKNPTTSDQEAINANWMMWRITKALNDSWEPNWDDSNEVKYYPRFDMRSAGVGFSHSVCDGWHSTTAVGSHLCFKSIELAEYAGKQFVDIYKKFMVLPNTK